MKKILNAVVLVMMAVSFHACNETLLEEVPDENAGLKSAQTNSITYIVVLDDMEMNAELRNVKGYEMRQQAAKRAAFKVLNRAAVTDGELGFVYSTALKGFSVKIPPGQLRKLENDPSVVRIEQDQVVTLIKPIIDPRAKPPGTPGGGATTPPPQEIPWGISRVGGAGNGAGKTAWIIDSGIDLDHPDLNVDKTRSVSFLGGKEGTNPDDQNGHGTHVAGTIAAVDNDLGVIGVAAGASVVSVRVLDRRGSGTISGVIAGVDYVAAKTQADDKAVDVANMSLGGGPSISLDEAVLAASNKCIFVIAAGNDGSNANNYSPARVNGDNIYTISAMNSSDVFASWSNWGNPPVDYCAPGVSIISTWKDGGYNTISGTSMAAPHAAGVFLLGSASTDGTVSGDRDKNNDPIIHR